MYRVYHAIPVSGVAPEEQDIFLNERGGGAWSVCSYQGVVYSTLARSLVA